MSMHTSPNRDFYSMTRRWQEMLSTFKVSSGKSMTIVCWLFPKPTFYLSMNQGRTPQGSCFGSILSMLEIKKDHQRCLINSSYISRKLCTEGLESICSTGRCISKICKEMNRFHSSALPSNKGSTECVWSAWHNLILRCTSIKIGTGACRCCRSFVSESHFF